MKKVAAFFILISLLLIVYGCGSSGGGAASPVLSEKKLLPYLVGQNLYGENGNALSLNGFGVANNIYSHQTNPVIPTASWDHDEDDFSRMASWGANCVRFYMDSNWFDPATSANAWAYVTQNIQWAKNQNLYLILDMHFAPGETLSDKSGLWSGSANKQDLIDLWSGISSRVKDEPTVLGYDILNEPSPNVVADWYTLAQDIVDEIRSNNDQHIVIVEEPLTSRWLDDNFATFTKLTDNNVLYSFHFYDPFEFTHQGASWVNNPPLGVSYPFTRFGTITYQDGAYGFPASNSSMTSWVTLDPLTNYATPNALWDIGIIEFGGNDNTADISIDNVRLIKRNQDGSTENIAVYNGDMEVADAGWYASKGPNATLAYSFQSSGGVGGSGGINITQINSNSEYANLSQREGTTFYYPTYFFEAVPTCGYKVVGDLKINIGDPLGSNFRISWNTYDTKTEIDSDYLLNRIARFATKATELNIPFYCGEFGSIAAAPTQNEALWAGDVVNALENNGIHWTYHVYRDYLGVTDPENRKDMGIYSTAPYSAINDGTENTPVKDALFN